MNRRAFVITLASEEEKNALRGFTFYENNSKWIMCPNTLGIETFHGTIEDALKSEDVSKTVKKFLIYNLDVVNSKYFWERNV